MRRTGVGRALRAGLAVVGVALRVVLAGIKARSPLARALVGDRPATFPHSGGGGGPLIRWAEPVEPLDAAAPLHPNITGMLGMANLVVARAAS